MTDHTIEVTGAPAQWREGIKQRVLGVMAENGINYPLATFRWSADELEVVNTADGSPAEGASVSIALPTLDQFIGCSANLIIGISAAIEGCMVTIYADGLVQAALNGQIIR